MKTSTRMWAAVGVIGLLATPALAQNVDEDVPPVTDAPDGQFAVIRGLQAPKGMFAARILLGINLSKDAAGEPISLAPDLYYGVTDRLQLGLVHQGEMGWQGRPGKGICFTGEDGGCPEIYDNVGFDLMYGLAFEKVHMSVHSTLFVTTFDPFATSLALGFAGKAHLSGSFALYFDPKIAISLNERDLVDDALFIPLELQFQAAPRTTLKLLTGLAGGLSAFGDTYEVPLGLGVMQNLNEHFDVGARFSFDNLLGHEDEGVGRADARSLAVLLNVRT